MIRKKPTKTEEEQLKHPPHIKLGGHMPYPPEDCPAPRVYNEEGIEYIDRSFCVDCKHKSKCKRLKEFENEWKEYYNLYKKTYNKYKGKDMVEQESEDSTTQR